MKNRTILAFIIQLIFLLSMGIFSFLTGKGQQLKEKTMYAGITPDLRDEYRAALQKNPDLPFQDEFKRTTDLEYELISRHGFAAIQLIFENRNGANYFGLGSFPSDCPWHHLNEQNNTGFIAANFSSIRSKIPDLVKAMTERCWFIYAEKKDDAWQLHYLLKIKLYDGRWYFRIYTGGAPNKNPLPNENLRKFNWDIPTDLKSFYSIHDGFGEIYDGITLLKSTELRVMAEEMNPVAEAQNTSHDGYKFEDLLEFFPDGAGNSQCFYRPAKGFTVDWDHETWEPGEKLNFFSFINQRMGMLDEE